MSKQTPQEVLRKLLPLSSEKKYADAFTAAIDALDECERLREAYDCLMDEKESIWTLSHNRRLEIEQLKQRVAELEAETERLRKWDLKQRELYDMQAQQNADHYKQRIAELEAELANKTKETES